MEWKRITRLKFMTKMPLFYSSSLFLLVSVFALLNTMIIARNPSLDIRCHSTTKSGFNFQDFDKSLEKFKSESKRMDKLSMSRTSRRILSGPGSWPPQCTSKCGVCTPCKPVHVSVPPGTPVTTEYYPEAWRCKCGNRLYMP